MSITAGDDDASSNLGGRLESLARAVGTPLFVIDLVSVRDQFERVRRLLPGFELLYSIKTNPHPVFLETAIEAGYGFDAASIGEMTLAIRHGANASSVLSTHPVQSAAEISAACRMGVGRFTFDTLDQLERLTRLAPAGEYHLRLAPALNDSMYDYRRRFGVTVDEAELLLRTAQQRGITVAGLSFHVGSQSWSADPWIKMLELAGDLITAFRSRREELGQLNIGSGFPLAYGFPTPPDLDSLLAEIEAAAKALPSDIRLVAEPGRCIAGPPVTLLTTVVGRADRGDEIWLYTDASAYSGLIEMVESNGRFAYKVDSPRPEARRSMIVAGKTLDPDDMISAQSELPEDTQTGDVLVVADAGAYTLPFFSGYHSLPEPRVVMIDPRSDGRLSIGRTELGLDVVAERSISRGSLLFPVTGYTVAARTQTSCQLDTELHVEPHILGACLNHSCQPNCGLTYDEHSEPWVTAIEDVIAGDPLRIDYSMFEDNRELVSLESPCRCGAASCRKVIRGWASLDEDLKARNRPWSARYLRDLS